ncbi:MAG: N-acetylglucosamine kinase [Pyrinomonadaceae bacterium]
MPVISSEKNKFRRVKKSHDLFLGVDGGGTKTQVVLIDEAREFVCEGVDGASNPLRVGIQQAVANILTAINFACDTGEISRGDIVSATLGLAGVRREDLRQRIKEAFIKNFHLKSVEVITDADIALYGATLGKAGLVVIAGTGSICIGQNAQGARTTAGGWGPLAGDEGGGAGISRRALQAIAKASDGRSSQTKLSEVALEYFRAARLEDLAVAIYAPQIDNAKIAGFAQFVIETAIEGDEAAIKVLAEAGKELALAAIAVIKRLKLERKKFPIAKVGSIFQAGELITAPFMEKVRQVAPKAFLAEPMLSPPIAAANLAYENFYKK